MVIHTRPDLDVVVRVGRYVVYDGKVEFVWERGSRGTGGGKWGGEGYGTQFSRHCPHKRMMVVVEQEELEEAQREKQ